MTSLEPSRLPSTAEIWNTESCTKQFSDTFLPILSYDTQYRGSEDGHCFFIFQAMTEPREIIASTIQNLEYKNIQ